MTVRLGNNVQRIRCSRTKRVAFERDAIDKPIGLCSCCAAPCSPLVVEYGTTSAPRYADVPGIFRYEALLPVTGVPAEYAADVGRTPIVPHRALSDALEVDVKLKLEAGNPSGSFKDRGLALAIALGRALGAQRVCLPTQGNAGVAAALFSARLGLPCLVYMPARHEGSVYHRAAAHFGARISFFGANIAEAGAEMRRVHGADIASGEVLDVSTFFEPGRLEGKKTMGLELVEQLGAELPEWIVYPTGGGTGLVGIWKAFTELGIERRPRMAAVQSQRCAPVVKAFDAGLEHVERVVSEGTIADGLDVPGAIMGHGILEALRASKGTAVAVEDAAIVDDYKALARTGVSASYEAAATVSAVRALIAKGTIERGSRVLLLFTAGHAVTLDR